MTALRSTMQRFLSRLGSNRRATRTAWVSAVVALVIGMAGTTVVMPAESVSAAVPGLQYVVGQPSAFNSIILKSSTADCPSGKVVVGISFRLVGAQGNIILDDLDTTGTSVRVQAGEDQDGTSANWLVQAIAVCANRPPGYHVESAASPFGPVSELAAVATCREPGTRVIGSGVLLYQGLGQISVRSLFIGQDSVEVIGTDDQDGFSGSWQIVAVAICADPLPGLEIIRASSGFNSNDFKVASPRCSAGKRVLGIGWLIGGSGQAIITSANIFEGAVQGGADFTASEDDDGFSGSWDVMGTVICASA